MPGPEERLVTKKEAALLAWIQQFAPYGVLTLDKEFRIESWNHWMEVHTGKTLAEVSGRNLVDLFPELQERRSFSHFERALEGEASVLSTGLHHYLLALPSPFKDFGLAHMQQTARVAPLFSEGAICGIVVVIEDVTQREGQAAALRRQHERDEVLAWTLAHLLKTEEPQKAVRQLFFKIAERLDFDVFCLYLRRPETGAMNLVAHGGIPDRSESDFAGCPFQPVTPADARDAVIVNRIGGQKGPEYAPLQQARLTAAVMLPLMAKEKSLGLLCFATSSRQTIGSEEADLLTTISRCLATALDREHANQQLQNVKEELSHHALLLEKTVRERTARLQETISELETFSYALAHDLREPVRGLTGYCEVLLEDFDQNLEPEAREVVVRLARAAHRLEALTHDLLAFSRVSMEKIAISKVEIGPIIEDLISLRAPSVREAITVKAPLHPVRAHAALLQQALSNLVDNGIKFVAPGRKPSVTIWTEKVEESSPNTRAGGLSFSAIEPRPAPVTAQPPTPAELPAAAGHGHGGRVRIWVEDQGIGIPRELHPKIFGIFERAVSADQYDGTGMGLAIVARAMQRMGGACGVESEVGKGSRFWLELPAG